MQQIDKKLAGAAVENNFGGWQLGTARREIEERKAIALFNGEGCPSMPQSCYNRAAWSKHWQKYWKLLAAKYEHADDESWFAVFDIANFYDSVDLRRLETSGPLAGMRILRSMFFFIFSLRGMEHYLFIITAPKDYRWT